MPSTLHFRSPLKAVLLGLAGPGTGESGVSERTMVLSGSEPACPLAGAGIWVAMTRCGLIGHRMRFWAEGSTVRWGYERGSGEEGSKAFGSSRDANRYARAFDCEDRDDVGRRAPLMGMLPLRTWRRLSGRDQAPRGRGR